MYRFRCLILLLCLVLLSGAGIQDMQRRILKSRGVSTEDITSNLEVFYQFEETTGTNVPDTSGNVRHGTIANTGYTWGATGKVGNALTLSTGTDRIDVPYFTGINPTTQSLTISVWVNVPAAGSNNRYLFGTILPAGSIIAVCHRHTEGWVNAVGSNGCNSTAEFAFAATTWAHIVAVWNAATDISTLWVNGVKGVGAASVKAYTFTSIGNDCEIGDADVHASGFGVPGTYDNFRIYSRVLTDAQIGYLFTNGL